MRAFDIGRYAAALNCALNTGHFGVTQDCEQPRVQISAFLEIIQVLPGFEKRFLQEVVHTSSGTKRRLGR